MPSKHTTIAMGGATVHTGICLLLWMHSCRLVEFPWHVAVKKSKNDMLFYIKTLFSHIYIYIHIRIFIKVDQNQIDIST